MNLVPCQPTLGKGASLVCFDPQSKKAFLYFTESFFLSSPRTQLAYSNGVHSPCLQRVLQFPGQIPLRTELTTTSGGSDGKESACNAEFDPWVRKIHWRRKWLPTPVFLPGEFHGQRSLVGYSPWSHKESDATEQLTHTHPRKVLYLSSDSHRTKGKSS